MTRFTQMTELGSVAALRAHLETLGIEIPLDDEVDPGGVLAAPMTITDGNAGTRFASNRFAVLPMEGWDAAADGRPSDLVRHRWDRFAASGAGLVWGEATVVRADGKANPFQLVLDDSTVDDMAGLRSRLAPTQVSVFQLTHAGRFARPSEAGPAPRTAYRHPLLDARVGADDANLFGDDELDTSHGHLAHELLTAYDRPGPYGGDLVGRTQFVRSIVEGIRERAPGLGVALRLSLFDLVPHVAGPDGVGVPEAAGGYGLAFGGDGTGLGYDLTQTHALLDVLHMMGVGLVCATAGSPHYVPHAQRPALVPPADGYQAPEDPLVGVARLVAATAEVTNHHPEMRIIAAGLSYLQEWLPNAAQAIVAGGVADAAGIGRMALSYPQLPADVLAGRSLDRRLL